MATDKTSSVATPATSTAGGGSIEKEQLDGVRSYIARVVPPILDGDSKTFTTALSSPDNEDVLKAFVSDPLSFTLFITKLVSGDDGKDGVNTSFLLETHVRSHRKSSKDGKDDGASARSVVFVKMTQNIDPAEPISRQLYLCQIDLDSDAPFATILAYVRHCFHPYSRSLLGQTVEGAETKDSELGVLRGVTSQLGLLEVELMRSQQSIEIPHITLSVHRVIAEFIRKQRAAGKTPRVEDFDTQFTDSFLLELQRGISDWKKLIMRVTKLTRDVLSGSTIQEINFWLGMESAIHHIYDEKDSAGVALTFDVLKAANCHFAIANFNLEVGLAERKDEDKVHTYSYFLRDFPIKQLLGASDMPKLLTAAEAIFTHLKAKLRNLEYPLPRLIDLMQTISRDVMTQLQSVINSKRLVALEMRDFEKLIQLCTQFFTAWDGHMQEPHGFRGLVRTLRRQRATDTSNINLLSLPLLDLKPIRDRIDEMVKFRKMHEELRTVVGTALSSDPAAAGSALTAINQAYTNIKDVDVLSIAPDGIANFANARKVYDAQIERVEAELEDKIRELLTAAKDDANEMFRVCAKFNPLFVREKIKNAIREYQEQLIATVNKDINVLRTKLNNKFSKSEARRMSQLRDLPKVPGEIIWMRQIERQLLTYIRRVEDVLGPAWEHNPDGRELKRQTDQLKSRLDPTALFEKWMRENGLEAKGDGNGFVQFDPELPIYKVEQGKTIKLLVNFDKKLITFVKEVRNLSRLGFGKALPLQLKRATEEAKAKYPYAMRLEEIISAYERACKKVDGNQVLMLLAAGYRANLQNEVAKGASYSWETEKLPRYVANLATLAADFQDQVDELIVQVEQSNGAIERLTKCKPDFGTMKSHLLEIQQVVDFLDKKGYQNIGHWVAQLDSQIEEVLVKRLKKIIQQWAAALDFDASARPAALERAASEDSKGESKEVVDTSADDDDTMAVSLFAMAEPIRHEIKAPHNLLQVEPPLEYARLRLTAELDAWLGAVCQLPRLKYTWGDNSEEEKPATGADTFRSVLSKISASELATCYARVEEKIRSASSYVATWLEYQALWDIDVDTVCNSLGNDLKKWEKVLLDMKRSRATFDTASAHKRFGPIVIEYAGIQTKVNNKYDQWHKGILSRFGSLVGDLMAKLLDTFVLARGKLEATPLDFTSTSAIVDSVTLVQDLHKKAQSWQVELDTFTGVEALLNKQRFSFTTGWIYVERLRGEWTSFEQILSRKLAQMREQVPMIQSKIGEEEQSVDRRIGEFVDDWKKNRPVQGDINHRAAESVLSRCDAQLNKLEEEATRLVNAKRALDIPVKDEDRLQGWREELKNLREVWDKLGVFWRAIDAVSEKKLIEVVADDLRKQLLTIQNDVQKLPAHMRQVEATIYLRNTIRDNIALQSYVGDLTSEILRPKHQKLILSEMKLSITWREMTVGHVWSGNMKNHKRVIGGILEQAQGEHALEMFLATLATDWEKTRLDMVDYRKRCFLIRNWDQLFQQIADNISTISSMKSSPYFGAFERDAVSWEQKLNQAQAIFDVFIDVQRRWVYLEGIFNNSTDVQTQLVQQYKRFTTFDRDFIGMMRDMKRESAVDYWIRDERGLLKKLSEYADTLNNIQKALGEYLERQRAAFPRFYFVGDEDLLEIIGNAKNPIKVLRHLPKMFAGIESLEFNEEKTKIMTMLSKEGEVVALREPIEVAKHESVHGWLGNLEYQMRFSLASLLHDAVVDFTELAKLATTDKAFEDGFFKWVDTFPAQIVLLASQVNWSETVDAALGKGNRGKELEACTRRTEETLTLLADHILHAGLRPDLRKKYEQVITELVHQRDVVRQLIKDKVSSPTDFNWVGQMRYYYTRPARGLLEQRNESKSADPEASFQQLAIRVSRASFFYGFEYLGVSERLVQTPLTDRVFLTLCEAMHMRMGGNPFGPAGTGKTESVKALGAALGRFVLVFNCDETFDFQAMGRIFVGLCQCGAWGCFDEFNRLEERILSAVSQQVLTIQTGLRLRQDNIQLIGKSVKLNPRMGIFVTMNPGYAGRSNLPDNLKQLFRGMAMIKPDRLLIGQVMLYAQGFRTAEELSGKVVMLFGLCEDQLSSQSHYDFGLRALKSVLRSAGQLKRAEINDTTGGETKGDNKSSEQKNWVELEQEILVRSMCDTVVPKLVSDDVPLFNTLIKAVFPKANVQAPMVRQLRQAISEVAKSKFFVDDQAWIDKIMQLYQIQNIAHGVITVGPSGSGKSSARQTLRAAMEQVDGVKIDEYIIDPKAMSKDDLYGTMDPTTLEWTNGVFTYIIRKIIDNVRGEQSRRHWIVFDGDVDPEWAENLNSVLDDNKLLTLPNGERLALTPNIRIMFEVQNLNHATPATVSRCGMVWFSEQVLSSKMIMSNMLARVRNEQLTPVHLAPSLVSRWKNVQEKAVDIIEPYFGLDEKERNDPREDSFVHRALAYCKNQPHIMEFTRIRAINSLISLIKAAIAKVMEYNDNHAEIPLSDAILKSYFSRYLVFAVLWSFGGSLSLKDRLVFCQELQALAQVPLPDNKKLPLIDYEVKVDTGDWEQWEDRVNRAPPQDLESQAIIRPDVVINTVDTHRHNDVITGWLSDHQPLILCGPPGSGKSMTLAMVLKALPQYDMVTLNFSSTTTPDLVMRALLSNCKQEKGPNGIVLRPSNPHKWLVIFCDEINLPMEDAYKTQHVITFLRQVTEQGGFWRASDLQFITLDRVAFIGACNPPTDAGRVRLSPRFLRHCPLMFVDFPALPSLKQIYGTFNKALLKLIPSLRGYGDPLTEAMVDLYAASQAKFTPDQQPHYIYSPRELSRWVRGMYEAMRPIAAAGGSMSGEELVRLWLHEGLRLFSDRLVEVREREWTDARFDEIAQQHFSGVDLGTSLQRPVLFSNWIVKQYVSVNQDVLRQHVKARLKVFYEEELDVKLVIFDEVLEHILRIDRVLRQPLGHLLLVGASGGGKTILSKFVAWMNGMSCFQIKVHKQYGAADFDRDLRIVLTRAGCKMEKICFIFDESNVLNTAFLERMNALLAGGEVPGLFEAAEWTSLMQECRETARKENLMLNTEEELYRHFTSQVQANLHVIFTMNPQNDDFDNRSATSPALFNRCVIDWFGEWSAAALFQVGHEFTRLLDLGDKEDPARAAANAKKAAAASAKKVISNDEDDEDSGPMMHMGEGKGTQREAVVSSLVFVHQSVHQAMQQVARSHGGRAAYVTPRHYLDFIKQYSTLFGEKRAQLEEQQRHLNNGLRKLRETQDQVAKLGEELKKKEAELTTTKKLADDKLQQIMVDQKETEKQQEVSRVIAIEIKEQDEKINKSKAEAQARLSLAEPNLKKAQESVGNIPREDLQFVSRLATPPVAIQTTLAACLTMMGIAKNAADLDWKKVRATVARSDVFIRSIFEFKVDTLDPALRSRVQKRYMEDPNFTRAIVARASPACASLFDWVESSLSYAAIKDEVQPLQDKVAALAREQAVQQQKMSELMKLQADLNARIEQYKVDYSRLMAEVARINAEMANVEKKVTRSKRLLTNLSAENSRWEDDSKNFQTQIATVVGDCLLSAAFLAYIGYFNQTYRIKLVEQWQERLEQVRVPTKSDLSLIEYLSHPSERLTWSQNSLPTDDLCIENAIMLKKFNRYPLVIDPSGQATEFIMQQYKERKIYRTSFMDDAFLKALESALRFGNALLVEDVENIDPVLNSVLNREVTKTGGRVMVNLGERSIDFSPSFTIFMTTRDPSCHFTPDLCSRVTFVNFTVTPSSLTSQCLQKVLKTERPDIDEKRGRQLALQGQFRVRLRNLEDSLLTALSEVKGNILDDDSVMSALETLKSDAEDIGKKMSESDRVMEEIQEVSNVYRPFAVACSSIYFTLENLADAHFLYQYSLPFFLVIIETVLTRPVDALKDQKDPMKRLQILVRALFEISFQRVARGLLNRDQLPFALRLAQIMLDDAPSLVEPASQCNLGIPEVDFFLKGKLLSAPRDDVIFSKLPLSAGQRSGLAQLAGLSSMTGIVEHMSANQADWTKFIEEVVKEKEHSDGESKETAAAAAVTNFTPTGWEKATTNTARLFYQMLICKVLRPDRLPAVTAAFVSSVFGNQFLSSAQNVDLAAIVRDEAKALSPLMLVSKPGFDASGKVDALAQVTAGVNYQSFATGTPEGADQAELAVTQAAKSGGWVLLKNVHLLPKWLAKLEKKLYRITPLHPNFRLFMTMEMNPKVPATLLRLSTKIVFEPPVGIKSSLRRMFTALPPQRVNKAPVERSRLYFLLAWLHAVVLERLRYTPVGWSKEFEFSETDQQCAMDAIDEWIDKMASGRANIAPSSIPWDALRACLEFIVYGGRIDNEFDQSRLAAFVRELFTANSYELDRPLASVYDGGDGKSGIFKSLMRIPDCNNYDQFNRWIIDMPDVKTPEMLGLPGNAEQMLLVNHGLHITTVLQQLQDVHADVESKTGGKKARGAASAGSSVAVEEKTAVPAWMAALSAQVADWLKRIPAPATMKGLPKGAELERAVENPLFRSVQREYYSWTKLLSDVVTDLQLLKAVLDGTGKADNRIRELMKFIRRDKLPPSWASRFPAIKNITPNQWVDDFARRVNQINKIASTPLDRWGNTPIWLGGLFSPEAFVQATRQAVAKANGWSLEQVHLRVSVNDTNDDVKDSFTFEGLKLYSAGWDKGALAIVGDKMSFALPTTRFTWYRVDPDARTTATEESSVSVPIYLDGTRSVFLFAVKLRRPDDIPVTVWHQRGTCITVWAHGDEVA